MDIDYFKAVNDTHGHDIGDEVLKEFASRIAANVRGIDLACRYGGEEFVVVMPDTDVGLCLFGLRAPAPVASRPRRSASAARPNALNITISIGIAGLEGPEDTADALLHRADQALYRRQEDRPKQSRCRRRLTLCCPHLSSSGRPSEDIFSPMALR